ncbi:hypothetical protein ACFLXP_06250 [Chloroflexota bacterium]
MGTNIPRLIGFIFAIFCWIFTYQIGGVRGLLAMLAAFADSLFIESTGIWLLIAALIVALNLPVDEKHTLQLINDMHGFRSKDVPLFDS